MTEEVSTAAAEAEAAFDKAVEAGEVKPLDAEQAGATLTVGDIKGTISIIDICSQRGAFRGEELEAVGGLRKRFAAFVSQVQPTEEAEAEAEAEAPAEEAEA